MALRFSLLLAIWVGVVAAAGAQSAPAPVRAGRYGSISGRVTAGQGLAQAGVPVTVTRQDGLLVQNVYTGDNGHFELGRLLPGLYVVEVNLPKFLPFSKAPISVRPGAAAVVDIDLRELAGSMQIGVPQDPAAAREDWKWALRTASSARPVLRFLDDAVWNQATLSSDGSGAPERPLRGSVLVSAGNAVRTFGADPGLRTLFEMSYDWTGMTALDLAASAGLERGTPAASLRGAWNHRSENGSNSTFSVTMRQLFLASGYQQEASASGLPFGSRVQSLTIGYQDEMPITDRLTLGFGSFFDSIRLRREMSQWSPFARLTYTSGEHTRWIVSYTGQAPRLLSSEPGMNADQIEGLLAIPQVSSRVGPTVGFAHAAMESGKHVEAGWERSFGARYELEAATFYDSLSDVALSLSSGNSSLFPMGILRDPFSTTHFMDGGGFSAAGARAAMGTRLWRTSELIVGYSYAGGIQAVSSDLTPENSEALREMLRSQREHSFIVKLRSTLPRIRTEVITSYRWLPHNSLIPADSYNSGLGRSQPFLNVAVIQPLPSGEILPRHIQAMADFTNLLAQGYLPVHSPDGSVSYFFPSARSFRGGFSFVF